MTTFNPPKRRPLPKPTDEIEQCVLDMRQIYKELTETQLISMLEKKYKINAKRARAILNREA